MALLRNLGIQFPRGNSGRFVSPPTEVKEEKSSYPNNPRSANSDSNPSFCAR